MKQKFFLILLLILILNFTLHAGPFSDVPLGHWSYDAVIKILPAEKLNSTPDDINTNTKPIPRYEFALIISGVLNNLNPQKLDIEKRETILKLIKEYTDVLGLLGIKVFNNTAAKDNEVEESNLPNEIQTHWKRSRKLRIGDLVIAFPPHEPYIIDDCSLTQVRIKAVLKWTILHENFFKDLNVINLTRRKLMARYGIGKCLKNNVIPGIPFSILFERCSPQKDSSKIETDSLLSKNVTFSRREKYKLLRVKGKEFEHNFYPRLPSFLKGFTCESVPELTSELAKKYGTSISVTGVKCKCGGKFIRIRVRMSDDREYCVPPIEFRCKTCSTKIFLTFDPFKLGITPIDQADLPLSVLYCKCGNNAFKTSLAFQYAGDELERIKNYQHAKGPEDVFGWFALLVKCTGCNLTQEVTSFECQ